MTKPTNHSVRAHAIIAVVLALIGAAFLYAAGVFPSRTVTAQQFVDFQEGGSPHLGFRRAHARGLCVAGEFQSSGALAPYTSSRILTEGNTPFVGRFSIGGGNPTAPELESGVRSLALSFDVSPSQQWRTAMNTPPVMSVATPQAFFAQLNAMAPDPETGERNPERIAEFFASHPETEAFRRWSAQYTPSGSFASEQYHSINAFYLVNQQGERQAVRWAAVPTVSIEENPYADTQQANDALSLDVQDRIADGGVVYDLVFTLADASDDPNNPTVAWPEERTQINAGQLVIQRVVSEQSRCDDLNFDPLIVPQGMAASQDPILRARSAAYAESYRRRARETWRGQ